MCMYALKRTLESTTWIQTMKNPEVLQNIVLGDPTGSTLYKKDRCMDNLHLSCLYMKKCFVNSANLIRLRNTNDSTAAMRNFQKVI